MGKLTVLLTMDDVNSLVDQSIALQKVFRGAGYKFVINFQSGSFAQFFVEVNCCAKHMEKALRKLGFNVGVTTDTPQATTTEECHDCLPNLVA